MRLLFLSLLVTVLAAQCCGQLAGVPKCSEAESKQFALCAAQPMRMNLNSSFPSDLASVNVYCREAKASIACIKAFSAKCLTGLPKQATNLLNFGINKHIRVVCKTPEIRREHGERLKCNNPAMAQLDAAMVGFININRRSAFIDSKVNGICCGYHRFISDVVTASSQVCSKSDTEFLRSFIHSFAVDVLDVLCSKVLQNVAICETVQYPSKTVEDEPSVSFLPPMLTAIANL
ncbi:hypothetical protein HDE_14543 [Halotydeus destructor]|nr:hypothetical protein HDE_14543 [Halotydeus destructor]